jgi:hypothetical protein
MGGVIITTIYIGLASGTVNSCDEGLSLGVWWNVDRCHGVCVLGSEMSLLAISTSESWGSWPRGEEPMVF